MTKRAGLNAEAAREFTRAGTGTARPAVEASEAIPGVARGEQRQVSAYLPVEDVERLAAMAKADDRTLAYMVRVAVREFLANRAP
jgi:predicted DNA-binding protein